MSVKYEVKSEALDLYFISEIQKLPELVLRQIPLSISFKYKKNMNPNDVRNVSFAQKLWVLHTFCHKKVFVVAQDEECGLSLEEFCQAAAQASKDVRSEDAVVLKAEKVGLYVGAAEDVVSSVSALHLLCNSPVYKYIKKLSSVGGKIEESDYDRKRDVLSSVSSFLYNYEIAKRRLEKSKSFSPEKLFILFHYADGSLKPLSSLYKTPSLLGQKTALRLMSEMMIDRWFIQDGKGKGVCYRITTLGQHELDNILSTIINLK